MSPFHHQRVMLSLVRIRYSRRREKTTGRRCEHVLVQDAAGETVRVVRVLCMVPVQPSATVQYFCSGDNLVWIVFTDCQSDAAKIRPRPRLTKQRFAVSSFRTIRYHTWPCLKSSLLCNGLASLLGKRIRQRQRQRQRIPCAFVVAYLAKSYEYVATCLRKRHRVWGHNKFRKKDVKA